MAPDRLRSLADWMAHEAGNVTVHLVLEDQNSKLAQMTADLRRPFSTDGRGKHIAAGLFNWGVGPSTAWERACSDPFYLVMRQSTQAFPRSWRELQPHLAPAAYSYVSLNCGDGVKDLDVLRGLGELAGRNSSRSGSAVGGSAVGGSPVGGNATAGAGASSGSSVYIPVDASSELVRLAANRAAKSPVTNGVFVLGCQADTEVRDQLAKIRAVVDKLQDGAVLFSLFGNTIGNYERDLALLKMVGEVLLTGDDDRLIAEFATTEDVSQAAVEAAKDEYVRVRAFREYVTSPLIHYTDLHVDYRNLEFAGEVEYGLADNRADDRGGRASREAREGRDGRDGREGRGGGARSGSRRNRDGHAILLRMLYRNRSAEPRRVILSDRSEMAFEPDDTIMLHLVRKYRRDRLPDLFAACGLVAAGPPVDTRFAESRSGLPKFGVQLALLRRADRLGDPSPNHVEGLFTASPTATAAAAAASASTAAEEARGVPAAQPAG
ncbi:hypothetical protein [Yinghuangia soli]|uniref:Uncharacterized protein n=1 Tax=Yinghuangia soli TaxID=2908204 RepID=A0AA41U0P5_9ACTN|nr:hypothetical protein [Yinghuangia soli]MCF2528675.1 hypothetical protein [Yinghuangia soli]